VRKGEQLPWIVSDGLWARIEPLLPVVPRRRDHPGRERLDDRKVLCGILFVLCTGIPWEFLPQELGFGSGMTCWRRLRDWHDAGVWQRLHESLLAELNAAGAGLVEGGDRRLARAGAQGWPKTGPSPVDRARPGSKHHLITEAHGIPLAVSLTGGRPGRSAAFMIESLLEVRIGADHAPTVAGTRV
jgi:transposase